MRDLRRQDLPPPTRSAEVQAALTSGQLARRVVGWRVGRRRSRDGRRGSHGSLERVLSVGLCHDERVLLEELDGLMAQHLKMPRHARQQRRHVATLHSFPMIAAILLRESLDPWSACSPGKWQV
eukprot:753023-Hanusia_phi.AAC.6